jgi:hypothetical protein
MSYGEDILTETETLQGTWEYNGEEYDLEVEDIPYDTYKQIIEIAQVAFKARNGGDISDEEKDRVSEMDNLPWEDEYETSDFISLLVKDKLRKPEVTVEDTGASKIIAIVQGMFEAWQESQPIENARDKMELDEGNG